MAQVESELMTAKQNEHFGGSDNTGEVSQETS